MLKDKLIAKLLKSEELINKEDDRLPLGMRGELEVIMKDRNGNILSYERGHNMVTNQAKMAIVHMLAGELGTIDSPAWSIESSDVVGKKAFKIQSDAPETSCLVYSIFDEDSPAYHSGTKNLSGTIITEKQYFDNITENDVKSLRQLSSLSDMQEVAIRQHYPTKMLFGTGMEANDLDSINEQYKSEIGASTNLDSSVILKANGFNSADELSNMLSGLSDSNKLSNYYSNSEFRCRTLQPITSTMLNSTPKADDTAIVGAIKNCYITDTEADADKYDINTRMAKPEYRGFGLPSYIYSIRDTSSFYNNVETNTKVHYGINKTVTDKYESEITFTTVLPAQPSKGDISEFYPYNGWILKQAGLFSDSRFDLRSSSDWIKNNDFNNQVSGSLLFKRNLSNPLLKTPDVSITFVWHVFVAI